MPGSVLAGMLAVEILAGDEPQHRVAQELQALVGGQSTVLVGVRAVGEREGQQLLVQLDPECGQQRRPVRHRTGHALVTHYRIRPGW